MLICLFDSVCSFFFFFFKQKTAYEMRISDWSSDVCSSDLAVDDPLKVEDLASKKSAAQEARKAHLLLQPHFLSPTPKCAPAARKSHQGRRFRLLRPLNWITTLSVWLSKKADLLLGRWRCRCGRDVVFKHF